MKRILSEVYRRFLGFPLRIRLFLLISTILVVAISLLSFRLKHIYQEELVHNSSQQTLSSLRQTAQGINQKLLEVNNALDQITTDSNLTDFFIKEQSGGNSLEAKNIYLNISFLGNKINRYLNQEDIDTYLLYTHSYILGGLVSTLSPSIMPSDFRASSVYETAAGSAYNTVWIPVYHLMDKFNIPDTRGSNRLQSTRVIFSAVRQLNFMNFENNQLRMLPANAERPIIMVNFQSSILSRWIGDNISYENSRYRLLSTDKQVFYEKGSEIIENNGLPMLLRNSEEGVEIYSEGSQTRMAIITPIVTAGWYLAFDMPIDAILGSTSRDTFSLLSFGLLALLVFLLLITFLIARGLTRPLQAMAGSLNKVGAGDFSVRVNLPREKELWELCNAFNQMGGEIQRLIHENYEISLKETQSQLTALNLQINPHFLYNTLNVMNMIALENKQSELSRLISALSRLLQYSLRQNNGLVKLKEELEWLKDYLTIMEERFLGMFEVTFDVDDDSLDFDVPKMILQPILENCFVHGLIGSKPGGRILLSSKIANGALHLSVTNNGVEMNTELAMATILSTEGRSGIGLSNAYQRLKLIYGNEADIYLNSDHENGTRVLLVIPYTKIKSEW